MKRIVLTAVVLLITVLTAAAQQKKLDYTTYDVIAKTGSVTLVVKNNDYRFIVGSLSKPKAALQFGYSKEQALSRLDAIKRFSDEKEHYGSKNRHVLFNDSRYVLNITGDGENEKFSFKAEDMNSRFVVTAKDCKAVKEALESFQ